MIVHSCLISSPSTLFRIVLGCVGGMALSSLADALGAAVEAGVEVGLAAAVLASAANEIPSLRNDDKLGDTGEVAPLAAGGGAGAAVVVVAVAMVVVVVEGAASPLLIGLETGGGCAVQRDQGWLARALGGWGGWLADDEVAELTGAAALSLTGWLVGIEGTALVSNASFFSFSSRRALSLASFCSTSNSFCKVSTGLAAPNGLGLGALGAAEGATEGATEGDPLASTSGVASRLAVGFLALVADESACSRSSLS